MCQDGKNLRELSAKWARVLLKQDAVFILRHQVARQGAPTDSDCPEASTSMWVTQTFQTSAALSLQVLPLWIPRVS